MGAVCDSESVRGLTLSLEVFSTHSKDHGWSSTVLNGCVACELYQIRVGEHGCDVVSGLLDVADELGGHVDLWVLSPLQFCVESNYATRSSIQYTNLSISAISLKRFKYLN